MCVFSAPAAIMRHIYGCANELSGAPFVSLCETIDRKHEDHEDHEDELREERRADRLAMSFWCVFFVTFVTFVFVRRGER